MDPFFYELLGRAEYERRTAIGDRVDVTATTCAAIVMWDSPATGLISKQKLSFAEAPRAYNREGRFGLEFQTPGPLRSIAPDSTPHYSPEKPASSCRFQAAERSDLRRPTSVPPGPLCESVKTALCESSHGCVGPDMIGPGAVGVKSTASDLEARTKRLFGEGV